MKMLAAIAGALVLFAAFGAVAYFLPAAKSDFQKVAEFKEDLPVVVAEGPQPKIEVEPSRVHTFEPMALGGTGSHTFTIKNSGESVLNLKKLSTTCKCTLSDMEDTSIEPGESIDVTLEWTPKAAEEEFRQAAVIKTNDPTEEKLELIVQGPVLLEAVIKPGPVWDVGTISENQDSPTTHDGAIASQLRDDFEITGFRNESGAIDVEMKPLSEGLMQEVGAIAGQMIRITVKPIVEVGRFNERLIFETNLETQPEIEVIVMGTRAGPFSMLGPGWSGGRSRLALGSFPASKGKTQTLTMFVEKGDTDLKFDNIRATPDLVEVKLEKDESFETASREKYMVTVTVPPGLRPGIYEGDDAVVVEADVEHPRFDRLNFTVQFRALPE